MGLRFQSHSLPKTREEVKEWYDAKLEHDLKGNIQLLDLTFDNEDEAVDWLSDNTDKWYGAKAVQVGTNWIVGGWIDY